MIALAQEAPLEERPQNDNINFIFDFVKDFPERDGHDWEAMETKAVQILTAASFIVGLASIGSMGKGLTPPQLALFGMGLAAYLGVLICVGLTLRISEIRLSRLSAWMWENKDCDIADLKREVIMDVIEAETENLESLNQKAHYLRGAVPLLGLEAALILTAVIWSRPLI